MEAPAAKPAFPKGVKTRGLRALLIALTVGIVLAHLFQPGPAMFSANDRSRWATVRSLVEDGTYAIGHRNRLESGTYRDTGIVTEDPWQTIDKVLRPDTNDFVSSKPPLLATLVAGLYWVVKGLLGLSIVTDTWLVTRILLLVVNVVPLLIYLHLVYVLIDRFAKSGWAKAYMMSCACLGTFVTTFSVTLNNHTVAAECVLFALTPALTIFLTPASNGWQFALAGFFAGSAACTELPAAAFLAGLGLVLLCRNAKRTLVYFVPMSMVPIAALLVTNVLAVGDLRPAYARLRTVWYEFDGGYWKDGMGSGIDGAGRHEDKLDYALNLFNGHHGLFTLSPIFLLALWPVVGGGRSTQARRASEGAREPLACASGLCDTSEPLACASGLCDTSGPLACASGLCGNVAHGQLGSASGEAADVGERLLLKVAWATIVLAGLIFGFYVITTSNYGGVTSGPRWFFWLTPLFLVSMIPAADRLAQSTSGRRIGYALLAISTFSAHYGMSNPWSHPWIYDLFEHWNWIPY